MLKELVAKNRSFRQFYEEENIDSKMLIELIDTARLCGSGGNGQPLRYIISSNREKNQLIFQQLTWAKSLKDWNGPSEGERPSAYIIVLGDKSLNREFGCDLGIAAQTILLRATELGLGGCILRDINRIRLRSLLQVNEQYEVLLAIALGKPKQKVFIESAKKTEETQYWRDSGGNNHVPKRALEEIIIGEFE